MTDTFLEDFLTRTAASNKSTVEAVKIEGAKDPVAFWKIFSAYEKQQKGKCVVCKIDITNLYHIDHIMPIARGGSSDIKNIQLLCPYCNHSKGAKHPIDFMQRNGYLL